MHLLETRAMTEIPSLNATTHFCNIISIYIFFFYFYYNYFSIYYHLHLHLLFS